MLVSPEAAPVLRFGRPIVGEVILRESNASQQKTSTSHKYGSIFRRPAF